MFDIFALLSQVGFFKSKYKEMIDDSAGGAENPTAGMEPSAEM